MKKVYFIFLLQALVLPHLAQSLYTPMIVDGKYWEGKIYTVQGNGWPLCYYLSGDTIINDEAYKKCYCGQRNNTEDSPTYFAAMQESDRRVYMVAPTTIEKRLLFDFNLKVGDEFGLVEGNPCEYIVEKDKSQLTLRVADINEVEGTDGRLLRRYHFLSTSNNSETNNQSVYWLEGVGKDMLVEDAWCWRQDIWNWGIGELSSKSYTLAGCYEGDVLVYPEKDSNSITYAKSESSAAHPVLFDLQGRRITGTPTRGIYVKEGKKYVVK